MSGTVNTAQDIGWAVYAMRHGNRVCRTGWNGKGMWLILIHPGNAMHTGSAGRFDMQPCIGMFPSAVFMQPGWVASQADLLATDWELAT
jgi:hypothetical protein